MLYKRMLASMNRHRNSILSDASKTITYQELIRQIEDLSNTIGKYQRNGTLCTIICHSEVNTIIALLALFKAHVTAVPLSARYGNMHVVLDYMKPACVVSDFDSPDFLKNGELMEFGDFRMYVSHDQTADPTLSDVAVIMCTSGTTGQPKCVMLTDQNILSNTNDILDYFKIDETDTILISRPLQHAAVLTGELLVSLIRGLDIFFYSGPFNPKEIIRLIHLHHITLLCGTQTLFYYVCVCAEYLPLKKAVISGECMTPVVAEKIKQVMREADIYSVYGLTEASPRVAYLPPEKFHAYPLSVGTPLRSLKIKIVDSNGNETAPYTDGEILVFGPSVMKGYYHQEAMTRQRIVDNWLFTGDIASKDENGFIYIKTRKDNMIIRAGMNVYPQEIENTLKQHANITDALAYRIDDRISQKIGLKIVPGSETLTKEDVMKLCSKVLPSYQIPDKIEIVDVLDKNDFGKLIRRQN